ncbi:MAG TPA: hypothetical protein VFL12_09855 [Thermoanaerobaculia bacterium]|nr:hypothetical protein [Thermoanaerobaculia bacterium]
MKTLSRWSVWLVVVAGARIAAACPLCADNLANDVYGKNPTQLGRGFFWSIVFMMAFPFLTVGAVTVRILIARKRRLRAATPAADSAPAIPVPEATT